MNLEADYGIFAIAVAIIIFLWGYGAGYASGFKDARKKAVDIIRRRPTNPPRRR